MGKWHRDFKELKKDRDVLLENIKQILEDVKMIGAHSDSCAAPYGEFICTCTPIEPETILEKYNSLYIK